MSEIAIIEPHYLPSIAFFSATLNHQNIWLENAQNFVKQTYRNRCRVVGANNIQNLTVPVQNGNSKILIRDIKIDYSQNWQKEHWRSIQSAYGKAPYYEFFSDYFETEFQKRPIYLVEKNVALLTICLKLLGLKKDISFTEDYQIQYGAGFLDLRDAISPKVKQPISQYYQPHRYLQVFGKDFAENMSIIDLLMNEGPNSLSVVTKSAKAE